MPFPKRERAEPFCTAIVPAAGSARRMGQEKLLLELCGMPILARTLTELEACPLLHEIVVVTREDLLAEVSELVAQHAFRKVTHVVIGGCTRTQSVRAGIALASQKAELIAIHDGARPFVTQELLAEVIKKAAACGAAAPSVPLCDTIKRAKNGLIAGTIDRATLVAIQTPQVFAAALITAALQKADSDDATLTDDCAALERMGMSIALTQGDFENIKITTPADLNLAYGILHGRGLAL